MALAKLLILAEIQGIGLPFVPLVEAMFNPNQLSFKQDSTWTEQETVQGNRSKLEWTNRSPETLTLELLFDTYERGLDVRLYTQRVAALLEINTLGRPPRCHLVWGRFGIVFQGVLQSLSQNFTLFLADGTPTRANLSCTFKEWRSDSERGLAFLQTAVLGAGVHLLQRGETLSNIAARQYGDPTQWRAIARANKIDNPLRLEPGDALVMPKLSARRRSRR